MSDQTSSAQDCNRQGKVWNPITKTCMSYEEYALSEQKRGSANGAISAEIQSRAER